jgi:hypothetical protein
MDSPLEGDGFEPSVPRLRWSSVQLAARDATHAAVVKRGTPDPFAATSSASDFPHAWRAFHMDKSRRRGRDRLPRLRASGGVRVRPLGTWSVAQRSTDVMSLERECGGAGHHRQPMPSPRRPGATMMRDRRLERYGQIMLTSICPTASPDGASAVKIVRTFG